MVVDAQGKVSPRPIKTGAMAGTDWIVTEGLQAGDQVVVNGLQKAKPGATVKPVQWNPNGAPAATPVQAPAAAPAQASTAAPAEKPAAQPAKQGS
jgi:membrane fusion protein (multidrug efflux system)